MQKTLAQLWNGNLCPLENSGRNDPELENLIGLIERNSEKLGSTLNEEEKKTFQNYIYCVEKYLSLTAEYAFCSGFSLASRLLMEALSGETE